MLAKSLVVLSVVAYVVALPAVTVPPGAIPLFKRGQAIKGANGVVNATVLRANANRAVRKVQQGLKNFEKNTGHAHRLAKGLSDKLHKRQSEPLTDFEEDLWFGSITVGNPAQTFSVDFDTGSSDTFLPGVDCDSSCAGHTLWNPAASSTAVDTGITYTLAFGDGSAQVTGTIWEDTVRLAGFTATSQAVGDSNHYTEQFTIADFPPDGLVGLAFPALSVFGFNPLFTTLFQQGQVAGQFGVKLADSGSEIFFGGVNPALFTGGFTEIPVVQDAFWEIALQGISINGQLLLSGNVAAIADTGTTLVVGDTTDVLIMYENIPGAKDASSVLGPGFFTVPCNAVPTISLTFSGVPFAISPSIFNLGQLFVGGADCVGGIMGEDLGFWVIGDVFLRNVYTSFDISSNTVGFATLA